MAEPALPQRKSIRLRDFDYASFRPYFVTVCAHDRRPLFADPQTGSMLLDCVLEGARVTGFRVLAVCIMPDHWHALVMAFGNDSTLGDMVRAAKGVATAKLRAFGISGKVWQRQFYDHVVRAEENLRQVAEYIVHNPVRKGLVATPAAYPLAKIFPEEFPP